MKGRPAFTLVELLVVIGVTSLSLSALIPAIQKIRSAADKLSCANNLRQIGVALHHYHNDYERFPSGYTSISRDEPSPRMTWLARLLPYVEQDALWRTTVTAYQQNRVAFNNPPHIGLSKPIKLYGCTADDRMGQAQVTLRGRVVALTSYLGVLGTDYRITDGILFRDSHTRITDIRDGSSNTIMVGERPPSPDCFYGWWYAGFGQNGTGSLDMLLGAKERNFGKGTVATCPPGPYFFGPGNLNNQSDVFHFWSLHPSGANFLFGDGSVRFIVYSVDPNLLPALATRNGGEAAYLE